MQSNVNCGVRPQTSGWAGWTPEHFRDTQDPSPYCIESEKNDPIIASPVSFAKIAPKPTSGDRKVSTH